MLRTMTIMLEDIWPLGNLTDYKLHFARWNGESKPLEVWARDRQEWQEWQEYRPGRNDFNRPLIFSLMRFYHEADSWLFGGIFKMLTAPSNVYTGIGFVSSERHSHEAAFSPCP